MDITELRYTIRHSKRAKYISLRIIPDSGLEVVLPQGYNESDALKFIKKNKAWLNKHADYLDEASIAKEKQRYDLIKEINLKCIDQKFAIRYLKMQTNRITLRMPLSDVLIISGNVNDARCCQPQLDKWLKQMAKLHLIPFLKQLSNETGLIYNSANVRIQRTRWGSCSAKGDISLNARLLYHPREVVRYVLIHELCHLKELNHSARFWKLVEKLEPSYLELMSKL
jgi:predicted metal-dependent hydrolase